MLRTAEAPHTFDMEVKPVVDELDQSVNMTLKEMKAISKKVTKKSKFKN